LRISGNYQVVHTVHTYPPPFAIGLRLGRPLVSERQVFVDWTKGMIGRTETSVESKQAAI
jgi:hypothetical protein